MPRTDIIKEILSTDPKPAPITRVNDRAKRFVNWLLGRDCFDIEELRTDPSDLHRDYLKVFDVESERVKRVMYDLAEVSGFFKANIKVDPVQEGKRCLFLHILGKITKEPLTQKE